MAAAVAGLLLLRPPSPRRLLGDPPESTFYKWKKQRDGSPGRDVLERISHVLGIFKALRVLHSAALADEWVRLPNTNPIFAGETPLAYMMRGGLPAMQTVRRLLDARRAG